jgi:hypothetical protein
LMWTSLILMHRSFHRLTVGWADQTFRITCLWRTHVYYLQLVMFHGFCIIIVIKVRKFKALSA